MGSISNDDSREWVLRRAGPFDRHYSAAVMAYSWDCQW
jgi:hypothetical protein